MFLQNISLKQYCNWQIEKELNMRHTKTLASIEDRTVFEYVNKLPKFLEGKFMKLYQASTYLAGQQHSANGFFIVDLQTGKICCHKGSRKVIIISEPKEKEQDMKSEKSMGHFTNWRFGVPVKVHGLFGSSISTLTRKGIRLIDETDFHFQTIDEYGLSAYNKGQFYYELIPYKIAGAKPRYPICQLPIGNGSYCNSYDTMARLSNYCGPPELFSEPTATLTIDGKEIELSAETVARLKKELGV